MLALTVVGSLCAGRVAVEAAPGWLSPVNLYVIVAMRSAERKAPVFETAKAPLEMYERELQDRTRPSIAEHRNEKEIAKRVAEDARTAAAKNFGDPKFQTEANSANMLYEQIDVPAPPRLVADDVTTERLVQLMADQGGRMAILSDEGKIIDIIDTTGVFPRVPVTVACSYLRRMRRHTHDDGSTHDDHASDTSSVKQEEFKVDSAKADTAGAHSHDNGEKHSH